MTAAQKYVVLAIALLSPAIAAAHPGHEAHSLMHGVLHPLTGLDHLLAMLGVGLLAGQLRGRAVWLLPASFLVLMICGSLLGASGFTLPFVEVGIALSLVAFGAAIALGNLRNSLPLALLTVLVGSFAIFHGHAHGAEMAGDLSGFSYATGFVLSTGALHIVGLLVASALGGIRTPQPNSALRFGGGAIACAGVIFIALL